MLKKYGYALEKFQRAVQSLVMVQGDIRKRLESAYLAFHPIQESDLPEDLLNDYRYVMSHLTSHEAERPSEGRVVASLRHLDDETAGYVAARLVDILVELQRFKDVVR